ncbi:MAG: glutamate synthase [Peptococcaceae bacterium BICA1-7]|nr:MAG: glutamate synthase [Peptococcaceae bacterium BICA1-7]HBV98097.1 glutamate synthase subunit beta [Desulfotomaculum sp.]
MADAHGFLKVIRRKTKYRPVSDRIKDFSDVALARDEAKSREQASRCMDCGTPFCHSGCPVGNLIPEWNDLLYQGRWEKALDLLHSCNSFPEFTGRLCPALCEAACVLGINDDAVTTRENELAIIEHAFQTGYIKPRPPESRTGKKVAVIGSGPAGLACADQLNKAGHQVTVFEKDDKIGGILRYGIPNFKLEKWVIDRRVDLMREEGVIFRPGVYAGVDYPADSLVNDFDAICLAGGSREPRDMKVEGRDLKGIYFAMDYLTQATRRLEGAQYPGDSLIDVKGRRVVVIGGGDTGSDCVGTAHRQGAAGVVQIELLPKPPAGRTEAFPWPKYPMILKTTSSHEEGGERLWSVLTRRFTGENGMVKRLDCVTVDFSVKDDRGNPLMKEVPGTDFSIEADIVVLALGFLHPVHDRLLADLKIEFDQRGNVKAGPDGRTAVDRVFTAGDMRRGQSLIVWAVSEGRRTASEIDKYLNGH